MILIISNKFDPHVDKVILGLKNRDHPFFRFNTEDFPKKVTLSLNLNSNVSGYLHLPKGKISISRIKSIWYRRPKPFEIDSSITKQEYREFSLYECKAAIEGLYYHLPCLWVSHPYSIRRAENKIYQLEVAQKVGLDIPSTLITNDPAEAKSFCENCRDRGSEIVIKTLSHSNNLNLLTRKLSQDDLKKIDNVKYAPCFLEELIPKKVEVRVTVVGKQVFAAEIHSQKSERTKIDWRNQDYFEEIPYYQHKLSSEIESKCVSLVREMQLAFGAIDMIVTPDGRYVFLENNPNGQWLWIERLTDLPISTALLNLLIKGRIA